MHYAKANTYGPKPFVTNTGLCFWFLGQVYISIFTVGTNGGVSVTRDRTRAWEMDRQPPVTR